MVRFLILRGFFVLHPARRHDQKSTTLTFRHITSKALERAKLTIAYALWERDLFRAHGPTAVRYVPDDERRQLARMGHDIGWPEIR